MLIYRYRLTFSILPLILVILHIGWFKALSNINHLHAIAQSLDHRDIQSEQVLGLDKCHDCRLVSSSIEDLLKKPRLMNEYGQVEAKVDHEKIHKAVCKDIVRDEDRERCRNFYFSHLTAVQKWKQSSTKLSFFDFNCIRELKYCCPRDSFGPRCTKCPKCDINERCDGEGTRLGNGTCICKEGHLGSYCENCLPGFYPIWQQSNLRENTTIKVSCNRCHRSCVSCHQAGPLGCQVCKSGYTWLPAYGCSDEDECIKSNNKICGENTFCVNTEGSYFCYECDRACDGCHGDGPDMCLRCARGYTKEKGNCVAAKKTVLPSVANYYRYAIYVGLCICTCIILNNSVYMASLVGLGVALYIGFSEYIMSTHLDDIADKQKTG